jgi:hypothetical protein
MFDVMTAVWLVTGIAVFAFAFLEYAVFQKKKL